MKCKKCGFEVSENDLFCANCGAKVEIEPNKKPNNKMKLIIAAIVVVICAGGIGFFLMNNNNDEDKANNKEVVSNQEEDNDKDDSKSDDEDESLVICQGNLDEITTNTTTIEATNDKVNVMKAEVVYDVTNYVSDQYSIDYDKADFDELLAAGVLTSTDESKKIVYVSLDETIKQQENSGLVCKKQ